MCLFSSIKNSLNKYLMQTQYMPRCRLSLRVSRKSGTGPAAVSGGQGGKTGSCDPGQTEGPSQ